MMVDGSPRRVQVAATTSPHGDSTRASGSGGNATSDAGGGARGSKPGRRPFWKLFGIDRLGPLGGTGAREKRTPNGSNTESGLAEEIGGGVLVPSGISSGVKGRINAAADSGADGGQGASSPTAATDPGGTGGRSRWLKLRTTVQLSGAITHVNRKHPLKREDSFLTRFSTRQIHDPASSGAAPRSGGMWGDYGSSNNGGEGGTPRPWYSVFTTVFNPDENALFMWLWILTGCVLYNAWTLIVRQAFPELQSSAPLLWYSTDIFSDIVYILDIMVQFRTGYLEQGMMVCDAKKLTGHYARSKMFLMDLLALAPLDLIQFTVGPFPLLRFPRFIKVYRSYRFYYMVESRTIYPNLWRVVNLIHILLLLAHWFGCFYYMLSEVEDFQGSWSYPHPHGNWSFLTRKYLGSVYWSTLTLTTIGDLATPATNLQYIFTIVSYLIGVFVFATIVGQVGNVITNRNASRLEFERLLDGAKLYMRHHKVPHNMQRRVQRWYDYSWSRGRMQGGGDINSALGILPDKLKTELALHVNLKTLKKVTIFQECQPEFLHDLVLKMKAYIFTPGDMICRKGEVAREMFIIADGILEVISESGKVLTQMKAGDFFGEIGILNLDGFNRRTADVCSVGYSELFSLSREDVLAAMKDYPEAQEILQTMGRKRLMEARLAAVACKRQEETSAASTPSAMTGVSGPGKDQSVAGGSGKSSRKLKPTMLKLKKDVQNLQRLLRSKTGSTDSKVDLTQETQLEMSALPDNKSLLSSEAGASGCGRSQIVGKKIHRLLSKIHSRSDSVTSQAVRESVVTTVSTEPQLPPKPIGEGLPFLERIKLLRQIELEKAKANASICAIESGIGSGAVVTTVSIPTTTLLTTTVPTQAVAPVPSVKPIPNVVKPSFKLLAGSMGGKSVLPKIKVDVKPPAEKVGGDAVKAEVVNGKTNVPGAGQNNQSDHSSVPSACEKRVPLLKKVLLKAREEPDQGVNESRAPQVPTVTDASPPIEESVCDTKPIVITKPKIVSGVVNSEKKDLEVRAHPCPPRPLPISPLAFVSKPPTKITPLIITPELLRAPTLEGYAARRTRLVRMQAFELDSTDDSSTSTTSSSIESQIDVSTRVPPIRTGLEKKDAATNVSPRGVAEAGVQVTSPDSGFPRGDGSPLKNKIGSDEDEKRSIKDSEFLKTPKIEGNRRSSCGDGLPIKRCDTPTEALLESYFGRVMKCMKQVLKTYLDETQRDLHRQITSLQTQLEEKSLLINELQEALKVQDRSIPHSLASGSTFFDDVTSLSSLISSVSEDFSSTQDTETDFEDDDDFDNIPPIPPLSERTHSMESSHGASWPSGLAQAATTVKTPTNWQTFSWDEEPTDQDLNMPAGFSAENLWRTEFPPLASEPEASPLSINLLSPTSLLSRPPAPNDWEIRMLVEEFDRKLLEQRSSAATRRHSYSERPTKHRAFRSAPSHHGRHSAPSLSSADHLEAPLERRISKESRNQNKTDDNNSSRSFFPKRGPKLASLRRRSLPHFSFSSNATLPTSGETRFSSVTSPTESKSAKKVSFFQRKRFSLSDISLKRRSSVGGYLSPTPSQVSHSSTDLTNVSKSGSSDGRSSRSSFFRRQSSTSSRNVSSKTSNEEASSPSLPTPTRVPENYPHRSSSSYAMVAFSASQSLVLPDSDHLAHHSREGFSSLHCLPTISEDEAGSTQSPAFARRLGHSQSFSEDHATLYGDMVTSIGVGFESRHQPIVLNSRTPSSDNASEKTAGDASDSAEDTPLVSTVGTSVAISIPEYQPLLSPP